MAMDATDPREEAFQSPFAREHTLAFRAHVRRDRKLGLWAAGLLGKRDGQAEEYAQSLIAAEIEGAGSEALIGKIRPELPSGRVTRADHQLRRERARCFAEAKREVRAG